MLLTARQHWRSAAACACICSGVAGVAVLVPRLYTPTLPGGAAPPAAGLLLSLLAAALGAEALWWSRHCGVPARGVGGRLCRGACAALTAVAALISAVGFSVGYRPDLAAWYVPLGVALWLSASAAQAHARAEIAAEAAAEAAGCSAINSGKDYAVLGGADAPPRAPSRCSALRACACAPAGTPAWRRGVSALHSCLWVAACATLLLCTGGAMTLAAGWRRYPPRGAHYAVAAAGAEVRLHAWCVGPPPSPAARTIFLDIGGAGHSSSDVYGLADALAAAGRRVCAADPPGTGWSRLGAADSSRLDTASTWSLQLLAAMGEPPPFVLVGTMDGGAARIYGAALASPAAVAALVPMQYGVGEFASLAAFRGWAPGAAQAAARSTLAGRLALCDAIRTLGTTWGVVGLVVGASPPPGYTPAASWGEKNFLNLEHEGQWDVQCRMLAAQVRDIGAVFAPDVWQANRSLAPAVRVLAIDNPPADPCAYAQSADDCALARFQTALNSALMRNMTAMTAGSKYTAYTGPALGWLGAGDSNLTFVAATITAWLEEGRL